MSTAIDWQAVLPLVAVLLATGFVSGLLAGLFGIGGGAVVVIALYEAFTVAGVDATVRMHLATGTALGALAPTTLRSFAAHHGRGAVDTDLLRRLAWPVIAGAVIGVLIASRVTGGFLKWVWIVMGTFLATRMALGRDDWRLGSEIPKSWLVEAYTGLVGLISALMSVGGGAYMTMLMTLYGRRLHQAVATSSGFGPLITVPAAIGFVWAGWGQPNLPPLSVGYISLIGAGLLIPTGLIAAPLGARIAHGLPKRKLELGFAAFMGIVVLRHLSSFIV